MDDLVSKLSEIRSEYNCFDENEEPNYRALSEAIKILSSAQRWIPCSERLPDGIGDYLLYRPHFWGANKGQITVCYWNGNDWSDNYKNDTERHLPMIMGMAWMPLPKAFGEDGDNDG